MSASDYYFAVKTIHILATALFIGNIFVTGWWKYKSESYGSTVRLFSNRLTRSTDWLFISGFGTLALLSGIALVALHPVYAFTSLFIMLAILLWIVSLVLWVISIQFLTAQRINLVLKKGSDYKQLDRKWFWWGVGATLADVAIIPLMIWKPL